MTESQHYTFGDTDLAAERLVLLARAFEPSTRAWLAELDLPRGARVLDLYARLKEQFDAGAEIPVDLAQRDAHREGKTLMGGPR